LLGANTHLDDPEPHEEPAPDVAEAVEALAVPLAA
jgi:hypothetical protein